MSNGTRASVAVGLQILVLTGAAFCGNPLDDRDRDGIPDPLEQSLLERFQPSFLLSPADCDLLPAEFLADSEAPRALARNGTIYGQVFPHGPSNKRFIEIHYYHLWSRDCGRTGHPLDTEHVAALVAGDEPDSATSWKAVYWFAAAHQGTLCDASTAEKASLLDAEQHGPRIWISQGKHASFLSRAACDRGCGGDRCADAVALTPNALINIGEAGAPLNGTVWTASREWPLSQKMGTDFPPEVLSQLADSGGEIQVGGSHLHAQGVVAVSGSTLSALDASNGSVGDALSKAQTATDRALVNSTRNVGGFISRAGKFIRRALPEETR